MGVCKAALLSFSSHSAIPSMSLRKTAPGRQRDMTHVAQIRPLYRRIWSGRGCVAHRSQLKVLSIRPVTIGHGASTSAPLEPAASRSKPSKLRVLFIEGFSQCDPDSFMAIALAGAPPLQWMRQSGIPDMSEVATAAWNGAQLERVYCDNQKSVQLVNMRIQSCLEVSHEFARNHPELLAIALVCIKNLLRQKK